MSDRIVLTSPGDVIAAVPSLLGFHPHRSLVALWTRVSDRTLICTLRLDLDTPASEVSRRLFDLAARTEPGRLILVAYLESLTSWIDSAAEDHLLDLSDDLKAADIDVADALVVTEGRYWSMICTDPSCCPIGGRPVPMATTQLEAELVASGHPGVAPGRQDVAQRYRLRPDGIPAAALLNAAAASTPDSAVDACAVALAILRGIGKTGDASDTDSQRAEVMWLMQDVTVRDWVIAHLTLEEPDHAGIETLVQLALTAPDDLRPRLAGAAAAVLYAAAESSVAVWAMVDHAEGDSLANLVAAAVENCCPPAVIQDAFREARQLLEDRFREEAGNVA